MKYFVISNSDGDTNVSIYTEQELLKWLNGIAEDGCEPPIFINKDDECLESDTNYWGGKTLIIKGDFCVPSAAKVVKEYKV